MDMVSGLKTAINDTAELRVGSWQRNDFNIVVRHYKLIKQNWNSILVSVMLADNKVVVVSIMNCIWVMDNTALWQSLAYLLTI